MGVLLFKGGVGVGMLKWQTSVHHNILCVASFRFVHDRGVVSSSEQ
jgi:hypothetical protein